MENGPHGSTKPLRFRPGRRGIGRRAPREAAFVNTLRAILEWVRESPVLAALVAVLIGLLVVFVWVGVFDPAWVHRFFGVETGTGKFRILEFIGVGMGGVLLAIGATIAHRRARAMEDAANAQAKAADAQAKAATQQTVANEGAEGGRRQERLKNAIEHLGHKSDSVRLGGAYELFHLARDTEDLGQTATDILCAHIRQTTSDEGYQEKYKSKPSEEVQSLLTLLFRQEHEVFTGRRIDLQESWLNGAMLDQARLQEANLSGAYLQGADLSEAYLQEANLIGARLQGAYLREAQLQGANLLGAQLQGARLAGAQLQRIAIQYPGTSFGEHIRAGIDQEDDLLGVTFTGGLSREDVDSIVKDLPDEEAKELRETLELHVGKEVSNELPEDSGAIIGSYTAEEAEQWIAEYAEATGESLEAGG